MNKTTETKLIIVFIVMLNLIPNSIIIHTLIGVFEDVRSIQVADAYEAFAERVESGEYHYTKDDLASRLNKIADGQRLIDSGYKKLITGFYVWLGYLCFISVVNLYCLRRIYVNLKDEKRKSLVSNTLVS